MAREPLTHRPLPALEVPEWVTSAAEPLWSGSGPNFAFAEELYYQYLATPAASIAGWRRYFDTLNRENGAGAPVAAPPVAFQRSIFAGQRRHRVRGGRGIVSSRTSVRLLSERVQRLVEAYRELGHLSAELDPLGLVKRTGAAIALDDYGLAEEDLDLVFSSENVAGPDRTTLRDLIGLLRETYCRNIGVELAHLHDIELRAWLQSRMEAHAQPRGAHARATGCSSRRR